MTPKPIILALAVSVALSASAGGVRAADLFTPAVYVQLDLRARQITLDGMSLRLAMLQSADPDRASLRAIGADNRKKVSAVFAESGYSAAQHAAWGARNADEIDRWLAKNPAVARQYRELEARFESLSAKFDRLR